MARAKPSNGRRNLNHALLTFRSFLWSTLRALVPSCLSAFQRHLAARTPFLAFVSRSAAELAADLTKTSAERTIEFAHGVVIAEDDLSLRDPKATRPLNSQLILLLF